MTFTELFNAHEKATFPHADYIDGGCYFVWTRNDGINLREIEAALLCARLLSKLPAPIATMAVELSEIIRTDAGE